MKLVKKPICKCKLNIDKENINVVINLTATRKNGNKVNGYYQVSFSAPVIEGEGYELRPNPFGEGISVFVNGMEYATYNSGRKILLTINPVLEFDTKEQAIEAVFKLRQHRDELIQMFRNKKGGNADIQAMVA